MLAARTGVSRPLRWIQISFWSKRRQHMVSGTSGVLGTRLSNAEPGRGGTYINLKSWNVLTIAANATGVG